MTVARPAMASAPETANAHAAAPIPEGDLPFEAALEQLEEIVRRLEKGDVPLDESVAIYERGELLKRHCEALLQRAEARIQTITLDPAGRAVGTAPLDVD
ncbi:exodeoxyribonuclease VII small subunit [uncultured Methylobacterium sp.]|uniref:exodeoxyribonuclease VII small subunit n=1 Tax=uncultured Methylobacterium sp. TaxID=157278 RepID=UPI0035CB2DCC